MQASDEMKIYLSPPNVGKEEQEKLSHVIQDGWVAPVGPELDAFESQLCQLFPGKKVLAVNSGTSALHLALILAKVSTGDKVVVSSFNFAAAANVVHYQRAVPVFLDSEPSTWNLDPELLQEYIKKHEKPKAVIVTHLYGVPAKVKAIQDICRSHGISLIEDAAESMGSTLNGEPLGSFGDFGVLSFNGNKIMTTGGGGGLIVAEDRYHSALHLATQANRGSFGYDHDQIGYNYRLSNVLAGIGVAQLSKLASFVEKKRAIFNQYVKLLDEEVFELFKDPEGSHCNRWLTTPLLRTSQKPMPVEIINYLRKHQVEARELWKPLHLHQAYAGTEFYGSGICERIYELGLCLPSGTQLTSSDVDRVVRCVHDALKANGFRN